MKYVELETCPSTNEIAWQLAEKEPEETVLVSTLTQTQGRGRQGRVWLMPDPNNVASSLYIPGAAIKEPLRPWLSITAGIAAYEAIMGLYADHSLLRLKWPNDLYIDDSKFGGILCESKNQGSTYMGCVIGIGINIVKNPENQDVKTRSLYPSICAESQNFKSIFLKNWPKKVFDYLKSDIPAHIQLWKKYAKLKKFPEIETHDDNSNLVKGTVLDLLPSGKLQIKLKDTSQIIEV